MMQIDQELVVGAYLKWGDMSDSASYSEAYDERRTARDYAGLMQLAGVTTSEVVGPGDWLVLSFGTGVVLAWDCNSLLSVPPGVALIHGVCERAVAAICGPHR